MAGRSATQGLSGVRSDVRSIRAEGWNDTGVAGSDTSPIGGDGRKGCDARGEMKLPPVKNIADEFMSRVQGGGKAMTGEQGQGAGHGKTL